LIAGLAGVGADGFIRRAIWIADGARLLARAVVNSGRHICIALSRVCLANLPDTTTATAATTTSTHPPLGALPAFTLCGRCLRGGCPIARDHGRLTAARCGTRIGVDLVNLGRGTTGRSGRYRRRALAIATTTLVTRTT
jgi:hypothetical protein